MLFDNLVKEYEYWFEKHPKIYEEEIKTIKTLLPKGKGIEIGVGTGRFAVPLGIKFGIEPSKKMAEIAKKRGIKVVNKLAEEMDFEEEFDFALLVTTICFVKDPLKTLQNTYKALKKGGFVLVAFVDLNSPLGREGSSKKNLFLYSISLKK
jgi:SAM-dependent methyltransferase